MGEVIVKRKVWIIVIIVLLVIIGGTWGYTSFQKQHKEAQIAKQLDTIQTEVKAFNRVKSDSQKLTTLKKMVSSADHYHQKANQSTKVNKAYQLSISKAQQYFKDQNQQVLKANTIQDKSVSDATIQTKNRRLNGLLTTIKDQGTTIYTKPALKKITNQVQKTIKANQQQATEPATSSVATKQVITQ